MLEGMNALFGRKLQFFFVEKSGEKKDWKLKCLNKYFQNIM